jgi:hypothetical protein
MRGCPPPNSPTRGIWIGNAVGYDAVLVVAKQASGINNQRRGLWRVLRLAGKRGVDVLLIEYPDRLARFGDHYLIEYLRPFDVRVETTQDRSSASCEAELTRDHITIVTVFSARLDGRRSQGFLQKITETIQAHTSEAPCGSDNENSHIRSFSGRSCRETAGNSGETSLLPGVLCDPFRSVDGKSVLYEHFALWILTGCGSAIFRESTLNGCVPSVHDSKQAMPLMAISIEGHREAHPEAFWGVPGFG